MTEYLRLVSPPNTPAWSSQGLSLQYDITVPSLVQTPSERLSYLKNLRLIDYWQQKNSGYSYFYFLAYAFYVLTHLFNVLCLLMYIA